ncbi:MAG: hypothetical protein AAGJ38_02310 [Planctomycetota bacterium]
MTEVTRDSAYPADTVWGPYRCFDGYALAAYALENHELGADLLGQTLDMIDANFAEEDADPLAKWHLADFAIHPLLRAYRMYGPGDGSRNERDVAPGDWDRLRQTFFSFRLHDGDLTENHNLLHLGLRYLVGQWWPNETLIDGRPALEHRDEARAEILTWCRTWALEGSAEFGSGIYYNVSLLALFNLVDFADEEQVLDTARAVIDLYLLDEALGSFAGAMVSAAHRDYAVYRTSAFENPSRSLQRVVFGIERDRMFNRHFIGGAIQAACSDYRPPEAIVRIAKDGLPHESSTTHTVTKGLWAKPAEDWSAPIANQDHLASHFHRLPDAMLGVLQSFPSTGRYTEFVLQATLDEDALVFVNQPSACHPDPKAPTRELPGLYDQGTPPPIKITRPDTPATWVYGHVPPGNDGDLRPGFWQGNIDGPRSFGRGRIGAAVYRARSAIAMPFVHVYLPEASFDEVKTKGDWVFLRRGWGFAGVWSSHPLEPVTTGVWAGLERRIHANDAAVLLTIGDATTHASYEAFQGAAEAIVPTWDAEASALAWTEPTGGAVRLAYGEGASLNDAPIDSRGPRFATPWGSFGVDAELKVDKTTWPFPTLF